MKRLTIPSILVPIAVALLIGITTASAQRTNDPASPHSGASTALSTGYDLSWYTIDGGGATFSTGGGYQLGGTIGQADAGVLSGGSYTLNGGFWGGASIKYNIFLPLALKNF
jgi:hypothetical protein